MILITGVAGFIGSNTAEYLLRKGYEVIGVDNLSTGSYENISDLILSRNFKFIKCDILNEKKLIEIFKKHDIDYIIHLASIVSVEESFKKPKLVSKVNIEGTLNILEIARKYDISRVIIASSASVYGDQKLLPIRENFPLNPKSIYAITNIVKEYYSKIYYDIYSISCICLRYFNVYGKKQNPNNPYSGVISKFIYRAIKDEVLEIYGDGKQTRDFIYVDDICRANLLSLKCNKKFGIYNIGSGKRRRIIDIVKLLEKILNKKLKVKFLPERKGDVKHSQADITLAKKDLKFEPKVEFEDGLKLTTEWFLSKFKKH